MKAGKLKTEIRKMSGNPEVVVFIDGQAHWVKVQKSSLIEVLGDAFASKADETGIEVDETKILMPGGEPSNTTSPVSEEDGAESLEDDEDDLLAGIL